MNKLDYRQKLLLAKAINDINKRLSVYTKILSVPGGGNTKVVDHLLELSKILHYIISEENSLEASEQLRKDMLTNKK